MAKKMGKEEKGQSKILSNALLDSSLIRQTNTIKYNAKMIVCGECIHLYLYDNYLTKKDNNLSPIGNDKKRVVVDLKKSNEFKYYEVRSDNAYRSKFALQRLIKGNASELKTFVTLTFAENITNIDEANRCFNIWRHALRKYIQILNMYVYLNIKNVVLFIII